MGLARAACSIGAVLAPMAALAQVPTGTPPPTMETGICEYSFTSSSCQASMCPGPFQDWFNCLRSGQSTGTCGAGCTIFQFTGSLLGTCVPVNVETGELSLAQANAFQQCITTGDRSGTCTQSILTFYEATGCRAACQQDILALDERQRQFCALKDATTCVDTAAPCSEGGGTAPPTPTPPAGPGPGTGPSLAPAPPGPISTGGTCEVAGTQCRAAQCPGAYVQWRQCQRAPSGASCPEGCTARQLDDAGSTCVPQGVDLSELGPLTQSDVADFNECQESTQPARGCLETSRVYLQGTGCLADCERDLFQREQRTLEFCSKGLLSDCAAKSAPCLNTEPAPPSSTSSGGSASSSETAGDGATPSSGGSTVQGLTSSPPTADGAVSLTAWGAVATAAAWAVLLAA